MDVRVGLFCRTCSKPRFISKGPGVGFTVLKCWVSVRRPRPSRVVEDRVRVEDVRDLDVVEERRRLVVVVVSSSFSAVSSADSAFLALVFA